MERFAAARGALRIGMMSRGLPGFRHLWIRQLLAIAVLPFTVTVLVPFWLARRFGASLGFGGSALGLLLQLVGLFMLAVGITFFVGSVLGFARQGRGTLAPWDPPRRLVVSGFYRYVRNPMIAGVALVLVGEALILVSVAHLVWAVVFIGLNALLIPLFEEPELRARFGAEYEEYCKHVPRVIPRLRPWEGA